ncbi:hypothetical protein KIF24_13240 [Micromonospora sp. Llam7]|uniref:hypothetical protein n=1 Tax=Micromonospora tarapacensis TaxID=2835305 RepID=UPI001C836AA0|nr:hypothetical protein [Micromonospora tarapacensis]MBX7266894.1 hypothetical protein [Micromonospora tarapacensis]
MAESVASDLAIARLIQKLGGSTRRSAIEDATGRPPDDQPDADPPPPAPDPPDRA